MHRPKVYRLYDHNPTAGISFVFFRLGRRMDSVGGCSREETRLDCEMIYEYSFSYPIKFCIRENPPTRKHMQRIGFTMRPWSTKGFTQLLMAQSSGDNQDMKTPNEKLTRRSVGKGNFETCCVGSAQTPAQAMQSFIDQSQDFKSLIV